MGKTYSKRQKDKREKPWFNPNKDPYKRLVEDPEEYKGCAKKTGAYRYESEAMAQARTFNQFGTAGEELVWTAYECPFCKKYHLTTNQTPSIRRAALARNHARRQQEGKQ